MIFFTSDTHFNHSNVIQYCNRPFSSLDEMNAKLIENWNERVNENDIVYHLGDFAMGKKVLHKGFFDRLNGYKILIRGNHDQSAERMIDMGWNEVYTTKSVVIDKYNLYLAHIPKNDDVYEDRYYKPEFTPEPPKYYNYWLCGHVHDKFVRRGNVVNVGVDVRGFKPVTLEELSLEED